MYVYLSMYSHSHSSITLTITVSLLSYTCTLSFCSNDYRPFCASNGNTCTCPSGRVARINANQNDGKPLYTQTDGSIQCSSRSSSVFWNYHNGQPTVYTEPADTFATGTTQARGPGVSECRCGRTVTAEEQFTLITANCPPLSANWRSSSGHPSCYGPVTSFTGNEMANYRDLYTMYIADPQKEKYPVSWRTMDSTTSRNSLQTVELNLPQAQDQQLTIKVVDSYGDGWEYVFCVLLLFCIILFYFIASFYIL